MKIKVISLNIWNGELIDSAVDFINKENPDILMLQEVFFEEPQGDERMMQHEFTALQEELNLKYSVYAPEVRYHDYHPLARKDSGEKVTGIWGKAIFSKYSLEMYSILYFNKSFIDHYEYVNAEGKRDHSDATRTMQHAIADINGTKINIFNTHGVWGFDGEDNPLRTKMCDMIVDYSQGKEHIILAGDFNFKPHTQAIKNIEKRLNYVFQDEFEKGELVTTFNMRRKTDPGYATSVVDLMFVSHDFKVVSRSIPDADISDHYPLIAELEL